jgi:hypothetical protein
MLVVAACVVFVVDLYTNLRGVGFVVTIKHNLIFACLCYAGYWYHPFYLVPV